jgi:hypothetical protein
MFDSENSETRRTSYKFVGEFGTRTVPLPVARADSSNPTGATR